MKELKEDIKNKTFSPIYLLFGIDYLKRHYKKMFIKSFEKEEVSILENAEIKDIKQIANAISFFGTKRLIIVKNSGFFDKKNSEELQQFFSTTPSNTIIFIEDKVDKRTKFFKTIQKIGKICEFTQLSESDMNTWLCQIAKRRGKELKPSMASYLVKVVGNDMNILENELEKLLAYSGKVINQKDINEACIASIESKIFTMLKAVSERNTQLVLKEYKILIEDKEEPIKILIMVARQIRLMLRAKALSGAGLSNDAIAKRMQIMTFAVREYLKNSTNFKYKDLMNAISECSILDCKIKQGEVNAEIGLELFLTKLTLK